MVTLWRFAAKVLPVVQQNVAAYKNYIVSQTTDIELVDIGTVMEALTSQYEVFTRTEIFSAFHILGNMSALEQSEPGFQK